MEKSFNSKIILPLVLWGLSRTPTKCKKAKFQRPLNRNCIFLIDMLVTQKHIFLKLEHVKTISLITGSSVLVTNCFLITELDLHTSQYSIPNWSLKQCIMI